MILSAAQTKPEAQSIEENLEDHYRLIKIAADNGADLIVFPEMSITGYIRDRADKLAFKTDDARVDILRKLSMDYKTIIIAGAPISLDSNLYIGSFIIHPSNNISIYTKQYLHPGEENFFDASSNYNPIIKLKDERISLAICADIDNPLHPEVASKNSTTIYMPSIFFSKTSMDDCHKSLSQYAQFYSMNILMSNYCGSLWEAEAGGRSAFWSNSGKLINKLPEENPGLLLIVKNENGWTGKTILS